LCTDAGPPYCARLRSDRQNCGSCAVKCGPDELCSNGRCESCPMDQTLCGLSYGPGPYCASLQTDNDNCGMCDFSCGTNTVCVSGKCEP
jgi:hypothetical protein